MLFSAKTLKEKTQKDKKDEAPTTFAKEESQGQTSQEAAQGVSSESAPADESLLKRTQELQALVKCCEEGLALPNIGVVEHRKTMKSKLEHIKAVKAQLDSERSTVETLHRLATKHKGSLPGDVSVELIEKLKSKWDHCTSHCLRVTKDIESLLSEVSEFYAKLAELQNWLDAADNLLKQESEPTENVESLKSQLDEIKALYKNAVSLESQLCQITEQATALAKKAIPEVSSSITLKTTEVNRRWSSVAEATKAKSARLQDHYDKQFQQKSIGNFGELCDWMESIEAELKNLPLIQSGKDLQAMLKKHKQLQEEFLRRTAVLRSPLPDTDEVKTQVAGALEKYERVGTFIEEEYNFLTTSFEMWKEFQELLAAEKVCLDLLERKIAASGTELKFSAADAEEYSEQLDLLERLMEGSGHHSKIVELGQTLVARNIIVETIKLELERYNDRRLRLLEPAKERLQFLETGVSEAQEFEEMILGCQTWMGNIDFILTQRLESDIFASDLPEEYKLISNEFDEQTTVISRLVKQVSVYMETGRQEAARRLEQQIVYLQSQMNDLRVKFIRFQKPSDIEQRISRIWRILNDVQQSIDLVGISTEDSNVIREFLDKSQKLTDAMNELKPEVKFLVTSGQKLIDIEQPEDSEFMKDRIDKLLTQYTNLSSQLAECRNNLEQAQELSRKLDQCFNDCTAFVSKIEHDLDIWESESPTKIHDELKYIQHTQQELIRRESDIALLTEHVKQWSRVARAEAKESVEIKLRYLRSRWQELSSRLSKWAESLQSMEQEKVDTWKEFNVLAADLKVWLDKSDHILQEMSSSRERPEKQKEKVLALHKEANDLKTKLTNLRDCAVELASKGEKYKQGVEFDLSVINARWEAVLERLKMLQRSLNVSDEFPMPSSPSIMITAPQAEQQPSKSVKPTPAFRILAIKRVESFESPSPELVKTKESAALQPLAVDAMQWSQMSAGAETVSSSGASFETVRFLGGSPRSFEVSPSSSSAAVNAALKLFREDVADVAETMSVVERKLLTACELAHGEFESLQQQEDILKETKVELEEIHNVLSKMEERKALLLLHVQDEADRKDLEGFDRLADSCIGFARIIDTLYKDLIQRAQMRQEHDQENIEDELDDIHFWLDETEALAIVNPDPTDSIMLAELRLRCQVRQKELSEKFTRIHQIKRRLDSDKDKLRSDIEGAEFRMRKLDRELSDRVRMLDEKIGNCSLFWKKLKELRDAIKTTFRLVDTYQKAAIYTPTQTDLHTIRARIRACQENVMEVQALLAVMLAQSHVVDVEVSDKAESEVKAVLREWQALLDISSSFSSSASSVEEAPVIGRGFDTSLETQREKLPETCDFPQVASRSFVKQPKSPDATTDGSLSPGTDKKIAAQLKELHQLRHWLTDSQRECVLCIDVTDAQLIKDLIKKHQTFLDQLQSKRLQIIRLLENCQETDILVKAEVLCRDWERIYSHVMRRKRELTQMSEDSRLWDMERTQIELWLSEIETRISDRKVSEMGIDELHQRLQLTEDLLPEFDEFKAKISDLNSKSNRLIDTYTSDDSTTISEVISELNTRWSRLNDNFRVHKAVLEATIRGRKDFQSALVEFLSWLEQVERKISTLDSETMNTQSIKDTGNRKILMEHNKDIAAEIEAHADIVASLQRTGDGLVDHLSDEGRKDVQSTLRSVKNRWKQLTDRQDRVKERLLTAQEQWERLTLSLREQIFLTESMQKELADQQPVGGDLEQVQKQKDVVQKLQDCIVSKNAHIDELVQLANSFIIQQDLRVYPSSVDEETTEAEMTIRRITQQIKAERETLHEKWRALKDSAIKWYTVIESSLSKMLLFDKSVKECTSRLTEAESLRQKWTPVKDILLDHLAEQMEQAKAFQNKLSVCKQLVDDVNDHSSRLLADNVHLSPVSTSILENLNSRYKQLHTAISQRVYALQNALRDFGPSSQHFLSGSVSAPWERAISDTRVPYYINHQTEQTSWQHPKMTTLMDQLCEFNEVKFSAYRTGMKLRALQKKLCLDLLPLTDVITVIEKQRLRTVNEKLMDVSEIVLALLPLFESLQRQYPALILSVPVSVDLCLNWILNLFDPSRAGSIRVLSFKVAIALLSRAPLEDKYKYLFRQVAPNGISIDQRKMALLLHDSLQIPKFLGEVAAFGGTNIEPSVRSCFEMAKNPTEINVDQFLQWLKCEPQSFVWMAVLHRIAAAETAKHQAKCNVCKMFPIIGLRYRCLKCFNFDMCQNCFFSQRRAKGHKNSHPMQEYCITATSTEDVKDFSKIVRNKFKPKSYWRKHPRLGYLPVQTVLEGDPIVCNFSVPHNSVTQDVHSKMELYASRLTEMERSHLNGFSPEAGDTLSGAGDDEHQMIASYCASLGSPDGMLNPKSPEQIVSATESMQKEEVESVLRQLQEENRVLQAEYDRLRDVVGGRSESVVSYGINSNSLPTPGRLSRPSTLLGVQSNAALSGDNRVLTEEEMLKEAKALRQHKQRLEARMQVLEDHNKQLESQLQRLKHLIDDKSWTECHSEVSSPMVTSTRNISLVGYVGDFPNKGAWDSNAPDSVDCNRRINDLITMAEDVGKAMGSLVNVVTSDDEYSGDENEVNKVLDLY